METKTELEDGSVMYEVSTSSNAGGGLHVRVVYDKMQNGVCRTIVSSDMRSQNDSRAVRQAVRIVELVVLYLAFQHVDVDSASFIMGIRDALEHIRKAWDRMPL